MSQSNVEIVQRGFEHFMATGEPHWETFHEEVEVHDHDTMDQGEYRGHTGVRRWLEDWAAAWSEFGMEPEEFLDVGEHVVMFFCMKATGVSSWRSNGRTRWFSPCATARSCVLTTTTTDPRPSKPWD